MNATRQPSSQQGKQRINELDRQTTSVRGNFGEIEQALLGLLRRRPMHAYEMYQQLAESPEGQALGRVWRLKQSHLYALLGKLEAAGYLAGTTEPQGTRPPRRMLRLTPAGETAFAAWVVAPVRHGRDFRLAFLAKLFFAEREGSEAVAKLLARQRETCKAWLGDLRAQEAALDASKRFDRLVLEFRNGQIEAILSWLDRCAPITEGAVTE